MPCNEERDNLRRFAEVVVYFLGLGCRPLKTVDVAQRFGVSRRTALRWMYIVQDAAGLVLDRDGYWVRPIETEQIRQE
jgi:hypothetical protein